MKFWNHSDGKNSINLDYNFDHAMEWERTLIWKMRKHKRRRWRRSGVCVSTYIESVKTIIFALSEFWTELSSPPTEHGLTLALSLCVCLVWSSLVRSELLCVCVWFWREGGEKVNSSEYRVKRMQWEGRYICTCIQCTCMYVCMYVCSPKFLGTRKSAIICISSLLSILHYFIKVMYLYPLVLEEK